MAVSLAFALSLPHLEDYTKYKENETSARSRLLTTRSASEVDGLLEHAEAMCRLSQTSLSHGATGLAIPALGLACGAGLVACTLIRRKTTRDYRLLQTVTAVCRTGLIIFVGAIAFFPVLVVIAIITLD